MNMLVIYDQEGHIISQMSGSVREPVGIPFLWVDVPKGKYIERIDVLGKHAPVFADLQKTEIELLREEVDGLKATVEAKIAKE